MMRKLVTMRETLASEGYFGRLLSGDSWRAWRVLLIAIVGEELTADERTIFESLTGRPTEPAEPVEEFWAVAAERPAPWPRWPLISRAVSTTEIR